MRVRSVCSPRWILVFVILLLTPIIWFTVCASRTVVVTEYSRDIKIAGRVVFHGNLTANLGVNASPSPLDSTNGIRRTTDTPEQIVMVVDTAKGLVGFPDSGIAPQQPGARVHIVYREVYANTYKNGALIDSRAMGFEVRRFY